MTNPVLDLPQTDLSTPASEIYERSGIGVFPCSDVVGAEIRGVDMSEELDPATLNAIHRAWLENCVIVVRNQRLGDGDLIRFSRHFGELDFGPNMAWQPEEGREHPEIFIISNVVEKGHPIGFLGDTEVSWHTDLCHTETPPKASTLYSMEIPADGSGDTGYMNMYAMLDALPSSLRSRIDGRQMKHENVHTLQGELRYGYGEEDVKNIEDAPGPMHPLVRTHPETGRKCLYLGRQRNGEHRAAYVVGMSRAESDTLLDEIWERVHAESCVWYHHWQIGDFVMWDNRCVMHRRGPFDSEMRRILHRTQIKDTQRPV